MVLWRAPDMFMRCRNAAAFFFFLFSPFSVNRSAAGVAAAAQSLLGVKNPFLVFPPKFSGKWEIE